MMQRILLSALTITVLVFSVARSPVFGQQPRRPPGEPRGSTVDYDPPPATLRGLFADVAVVVRGQVVSSSPRRYDLRNRAIPLTAHDFQIHEVFKLDPAFPKNASTITVIQHGGTIVDQNDKAITGGLKDIYKPGQELIVFLTVAPRAGGFMVAYGPAGSFSIMNEEVLIPEVVRSYPEFDGRQSIPAATFVQLLRQLAIAK
jgi:hypothetical protein